MALNVARVVAFSPRTAHTARRMMRRALGALWILDGLLQLQPGMFTMAMLHDVMAPLAQGQSLWVQNLIQWAIGVMTPHVAIWNLGIALLQLAIGVLVLWERRPGWVRVGLMLSVGWSLLVWVFGEGFGGILTGSASVLTGAPGSVLLYGFLSWALLLDGRVWRWGRSLHVVRDAIAVFWALAAIQQLAPVFWTPTGLSSQFQSTLMMEPSWLAGTMNWIVALTFRAPVLVNLLFVAIMGGLAVGLAGPRPKGIAFVGEAVWLLFIWWFGQGFGGLFTGMATDPNTVPLLAVMSIPAYLTWRDRRAAAPLARAETQVPGSPAAS
jgi:hypothetical protein